MKTSALHLIHTSYVWPILQMRKLKLREIKYLAEVSKWQRLDLNTRNLYFLAN